MTAIRSNASDVAKAIAAKGGPSTLTAVRSTTEHYGMVLQRRVMARASGRPGPRVITGDYRRSITRSGVYVVAGAIGVEVSTNRPQAWRLEKGFTGTDSAGRVYDQPPYEHFSPAFHETEHEYLAGLAAKLAELIAS